MRVGGTARILIILTLLVFSTAAASAGPAGGGKIKATFRQGSGSIKDGNRVTMEGGVVISHDDVKIECDRAVYDQKAGLLTADGHVRLTYRETHVEADSLVYHTETKEGHFQGRVRLTRAESKAAKGKEKKDGFTLTCGTLVFSLPKEEMTANTDIRLVHKEFSATAETLTYNDASQEMRLLGRPTLSRRREKVTAEEILLDVKEDTFTLRRAVVSIAGEDAEPVSVSFDRGGGRLKTRTKVDMMGEVAARHGSTAIAAPQAVYDDEAGTISFTGGVDLRSKEAAVTASELLYERDKRSGTCRGDVRLVRPEEKDAAGKTIKDGLTLDCDELDFATEGKTFTARGGARLRHRDVAATAEEMRYDDAHQELLLRGSPVLTQKDQEIRAAEVRLAMEEDAFFLREAAVSFTGENPVNVSFQTGKGSIKGDHGDEVIMEGDVRAIQDKTSMRSDRAVYDKRAGTISFRGQVELVREDLTIKAAELDYRRADEEGAFRGEVLLVRKEEKDAAGKVIKDGFSLRCAEMTFAAERKDFTARGGVLLEEARFRASAEEMRYNDRAQELTLLGEPRLTRGDETAEAGTIVVSVQKHTFKLIQAIIGFKVEGQDAAKDAGQKPPAP